MADSDCSSSDESLDPKSEKFDALKVLYSAKARIPVPNAAIFDNVSKFESVVEKGITSKSSQKVDKSTPEESTKRRFLPHQEPIKVDRAESLNKLGDKNVLARMKKHYGPLGQLFEYMENRRRVKVFTRNERGIRGYVEAYVAAFDKHWNLALEDCYETWTRKAKRKAPVLGNPVDLDPNDPLIPKVIVKKRNGKQETLERHVPQMLVRGEQIALIVQLG